MRMKVATSRAILARLNIMCGFAAIVQMTFSLWFYIVINNAYIVNRTISTETDREEKKNQNNFEVLANVWNLNGSIWFLGVLATVVLICIALSVRIIQNVNLVGAIRLLWVMLWVIPLQVKPMEAKLPTAVSVLLKGACSLTDLLYNWIIRLLQSHASVD